MREITNISQLSVEKQKELANENAKQALRDKHKDKKAAKLTKADVDEWNKQKMVEELGLDTT